LRLDVVDVEIDMVVIVFIGIEFLIVYVICTSKYGTKVQKVTNYARFFKNKMKIFFKPLIFSNLFL